jgi:hypothetical protein
VVPPAVAAIVFEATGMPHLTQNFASSATVDPQFVQKPMCTSQFERPLTIAQIKTENTLQPTVAKPQDPLTDLPSISAETSSGPLRNRIEYKLTMTLHANLVRAMAHTYKLARL